MNIHIYIYTYIDIYVYAFMCMYTCMYTCMYGCMYACMYVCISITVSIYIYIYIFVYKLCKHGCFDKGPTHGSSLAVLLGAVGALPAHGSSTQIQFQVLVHRPK